MMGQYWPQWPGMGYCGLEYGTLVPSKADLVYIVRLGLNLLSSVQSTVNLHPVVSTTVLSLFPVCPDPHLMPTRAPGSDILNALTSKKD
jgi:hypothetical protein